MITRDDRREMKVLTIIAAQAHTTAVFFLLCSECIKELSYGSGFFSYWILVEKQRQELYTFNSRISIEVTAPAKNSSIALAFRSSGLVVKVVYFCRCRKIVSFLFSSFISFPFGLPFFLLLQPLQEYQKKYLQTFDQFLFFFQLEESKTEHPIIWKDSFFSSAIRLEKINMLGNRQENLGSLFLFIIM